jgi:phenylpropionate dioxygenase-like ring-hydroxylating dioxygenase large terminal subunit
LTTIYVVSKFSGGTRQGAVHAPHYDRRGTVTELLSPSERANLHQPISTARGLPNRAYYDGEWHQAEQERIFSQSWVAVAFAHQVPTRGDVRPVTLAQASLVLVRGDDDQLRAFHNVSQYDSCEVVAEPASGLTHLLDRYHGWTWNLNGELISIPYWDGTPNPPVSQLPSSGDLVAVSCAEWLDLVFVSLSPNPQAFVEYIAPIVERLADADLSEFVPANSADATPWISSGVIPANWKIAIENDVELLHAGYRLSPYSPKVDANGAMTCLAVADRGLYGLAAPMHEYFDEAEAELLPLIPVAGRPWLEHFHIYDLYPNVQIGVGANHFTLGILRPDGPTCTHNDVAFYLHQSVADDAEVTAMVAQVWDETRAEDNVVCAATQRGRMTNMVEPTYYSPFWDHHVQQFHQHIVRDLLGGK